MSADLLALGAAIAGLFAGPLVLWSGRGNGSWRAALDGFVIAIVTGLCLIHLGPHALEHGGWWAASGFVIGALLPMLLHRVEYSNFVAWGGIALLSAHATVDGAALTVASEAMAPALAGAVVVHRLPMGLVIAGYASSRQRALLALAALSACTVLGFVVGSETVQVLGEPGEALLEGLIVGGLLHVVTAHRMPRRDATGVAAVEPEVSSCHHDHGHDHDHAHGHDHAHDHDHDHAHGHDHDHGHDLHEHLHHHAPHDPQQRRWSAGGAVVGLLLVLSFFALAAGDHSLHHVEATGRALLSLTLTSAPALLLGFVLAGLASGLLSASQGWLQGGGRGWQALKGVGFGLPLPICSCGVVPVYRSLVRGGVPLTAALAFLVATPELGLDAVLLSVPLLGLPLTIARVVAAFGVAVVVAWLVGMGMPQTEAAAPGHHHVDAPPLADRLKEGLRYGLVDLVDDTLPWIATGLIIAALAEPLLGHEVLLGLPSAVQVPLAALLGIPLYVCASGATPLAAMAVHKGLSAGAALTFLLAGPATNATTFGVLSALHGRALALRFGVVLTAVAVLTGWGVDALGVSLPVMAHPDDLEAHGPDPLGWVAMVVLIGLGMASLARLGARGVVDQVLQPVHDH